MAACRGQISTLATVSGELLAWGNQLGAMGLSQDYPELGIFSS